MTITVFCSDRIYDIAYQAVRSLAGALSSPFEPEGSAVHVDVYARVSLILLAPILALLLRMETHHRSTGRLLHDSTVCRPILDICHRLSYSANELRERLPSHAAFLLRLQPYLHALLNLSVVTSRPAQTATTIRLRDHGYPITDVLLMVWQVRYGTDLYHPHASWISSLMHDAFVTVTSTPADHPNEETHLTTIINCFSVMCKWNGGDVIPDVYSILSWAITHEAILLQHSALKFISVVFREDESGDAVGRLVEKMGGISRFSEVLASVGPALNDDSTRAPSYYLWIRAYLDIVCVLASHTEWIGHVMSDGHADRCLDFAGYLIACANESRWDVDVTVGRPSTFGRQHRSPSIAEFIGWDYEFQFWNFRPISHHLRNPYIRAIWHSLVQIFVRCNKHRPDFIARHHREIPDAPDLRPIVACVAWQICDTHPIPDSVAPLMVDYTQEVILGLHRHVQIPDGTQERIHDALDVLHTLTRRWRRRKLNTRWDQWVLRVREMHQFFTNVSHRLG